MIKKQIIILKNDAVGDLTHSLQAINNIVNNHIDHDITIFLSERSINFSFLIKGDNINFKTISYKLSVKQKIYLFKLLFNRSIKKVYILSPKKFYYYLPPIFQKIKFYAICVNGLDNYKRPNEYLRKFLSNYVINDRAAIFKRDSTSHLQTNLTKSPKNHNLGSFFFLNKKNFLNKYFDKDYAYFHIKAQIIEKLGWSNKDLNRLFNEILKFHKYIFITRDIEDSIEKKKYEFGYDLIDLKNPIFKNSNNVIIFDNIEGIDLFNLIRNSNKVIAFHGMMTNLASLCKKKVLDLYFCQITNYKEYINYRNSFYEFKPKYEDYNFIIPSKNIDKTIKKIQFALKK